MSEAMLRPYAKGCIALSELAKGVSSYKSAKNENRQITLIPYTEIPYSEKWIFETPDLLEEFKKHIEQKQIDIWWYDLHLHHVPIAFSPNLDS